MIEAARSSLWVPTLALEAGDFGAALEKVFLDPTGKVLIVIAVTALCGLFVGAIPGLTATMAVALLVPATYFLDEVSSLAAIVTLTACAIFSGDIPTTLLRIPGTPASAAYCDDAYALTRAGKHRSALSVCLVFSAVGGLFGTAVLILAAPYLAPLAESFSSFERFWLAAIGLSCAAVVARGSALRGALALSVGILLACVGLSDIHGTPRFTFGLDPLIGGIQFIPAMIGLFGFSEVLKNLLRGLTGSFAADLSRDASERPFTGAWRLWWNRKTAALRSSAIGTVVGSIPGAGADIAAWVSLALSKRFSRRAHEYGRGSLEGVGDATAANNAALAGAWVPALIFGIPGDSVTAIVLGVLLLKNVRPGPEIFSKQPVLVASIFVVFVLANLLLVPLGLLAIRASGYLIRIPKRVLLPLIAFFCVFGAYAINCDAFHVAVMLGMGLLGFTLETLRIPLGPVVLGLILGGDLERYFLQGMTKSDGSLLGFVSRPASAILAFLCLAIWLLPTLKFLRRRPDGAPEER